MNQKIMILALNRQNKNEDLQWSDMPGAFETNDMTGRVIWWLFKVVSDTRLLLFLCTWTLTLTVPGKLHAIKPACHNKTRVRWRVLYHGYHGPNIIDVRMVDFCTVLFHSLLFNPNI